MNLRSEQTDRLFKAILSLESIDECYALFEDLCTIKELKDMTQRFEAARLLSEGSNYLGIAKELGLSTATISRVSRCLNYGEGGYNLALERVKEAEPAD